MVAGGPLRLGRQRPSGAEAAYAELHCHSHMSFLDGASAPEELVARAQHLGLSALALTDHASFGGVVRFARAAAAVGLPTVFGAELTLVGWDEPEVPPRRTGLPDPPGTHLVVLARDPEGYRRLSRLLAEAHLAGQDRLGPRCHLADLAEAHGGHWMVLTGCRKGPLARALEAGGPALARRRLAQLTDALGAASVAVELWHHGDPLDTARNDALAELAVRQGLELVATNVVHYATPAHWPLATVLAAVRAGRPLAELEPWLPAHPAACLRSPAEQARRFARWPGAVEAAARIGAACAFDLRLLAPGLPRGLAPPGFDDQTWLTQLVHRGAQDRYGPREAERVPGAWAQLDHELAVIGQLGYAGYFLVVHDIVTFCRRHGILCQGRGSAANSAVCYALGITQADPVALGLLFERFLSPAREGPPDIDLDIESSRRDQVFQYVFRRYGRQHAAQVAALVTYQPRSAVRDVARALGYPEDQVARFRQALERRQAPSQAPTLPPLVAGLAAQLLDTPRHLGLHSAGVVLADRPIVEICPVQWARTPGRSVLQWDKDDCAAAGLVKFDLLGLGMLDAIHRTLDLVAQTWGQRIDLATLPQEPEVYDLICRADTVGVFQVESRAQMATAPRVQPRCFADLVVQVALIRPGPIQGGSVHPYLRRRQGLEPPEPPHPLLGPALAKTLGVPLFQEQLMHIAIDAAGFSPTEADQLRQAMSAKRSQAAMAALHDRLRAGMAERGIPPETAQLIIHKLQAFASFGFPESHAISFAYLVYASAWLKLHYPPAFYAGLLDAQPMGFWSPQTLVADARRHGVVVRRPHVNRSQATGHLETDPRSGQVVLRLGLGLVRGLGPDLARRIAAHQPYRSVDQLARRCGLGSQQLEALATAGALVGLPALPRSRRLGRRQEALWVAGALGTPGAAHGVQRLPGIASADQPPPLPPTTPTDELARDLWATGLTVGPGAMALLRPALAARGVLRAADLRALPPAGPDGPSSPQVTVAGVVTHRQRPESARGTVFLNLEDETGMVGVVLSPGAWARWRALAQAPALEVRGRLERTGPVASVVAERLAPLALGDLAVPPSRDFR
ncbi:error-prone DNA polymerase [Aciditerrimonas ferrireducens]|uniref:error-prone DNA polymerase n=1 Tax=Aciditerrimonas ferrireducens TaxID=667306 RepID=UPI00249E0AFB